jgi:hypothetical protein
MLDKNITELPKGNAHFLIDGPTGAIEVKTHTGQMPIRHVGLICHPNPQQEGTMDNKVVHTTARAFERLGAASVRFNYRGVGKSEGVFGQVSGECDDFRAVVEWAQKMAPQAKLWFAGFSFGGYIAAKVAEQYPVEQLLSIAPAVHLMDYTALNVDCPWTVFRALADEVVSAEAIQDWLTKANRDIQCIDFPECSHFFHGQLVKLRQTIEDVFSGSSHNTMAKGH